MAAYVDPDGLITMMADSCFTVGSQVYENVNPKIAAVQVCAELPGDRFGTMLLGAVGSGRMAQVLRTWAPPRCDDLDEYPEFMAERLAEFLITGSESIRSFAYGDLERDIDGDILVGFAGVLWAIRSDFTVIRERRRFATTGTGAEVAFGALEVLETYAPNMGPKDRLQLVGEVTAQRMEGIRPPWRFAQAPLLAPRAAHAGGPPGPVRVGGEPAAGYRETCCGQFKNLLCEDCPRMKPPGDITVTRRTEGPPGEDSWTCTIPGDAQFELWRTGIPDPDVSGAEFPEWVAKYTDRRPGQRDISRKGEGPTPSRAMELGFRTYPEWERLVIVKALFEAAVAAGVSGSLTASAPNAPLLWRPHGFQHCGLCETHRDCEAERTCHGGED